VTWGNVQTLERTQNVRVQWRKWNDFNWFSSEQVQPDIKMRRKLDINTHIHYNIYLHCGLCRYSSATKYSPDESLRPDPQRAVFGNYRGYRRVRDCITAAAVGTTISPGYYLPGGPMVISNSFQTQHHQIALLPFCTSDLTAALHLRPAERWQRWQDVWRRLDLSNFCSGS